MLALPPNTPAVNVKAPGKVAGTTVKLSVPYPPLAVKIVTGAKGTLCGNTTTLVTVVNVIGSGSSICKSNVS